MKKYKSGIIFSIVIILVTLCACADGSNIKTQSTTISETICSESGLCMYEIITQKDAKEIIDSGVDCVILDVRTKEEFDEGHIQGAINIDHEQISKKASDVLVDKDALILVYCRSGRRSKIAAQALADMGYTNVKEFGGIIDWPYEIVK